jgi:hypothetical protein
MCVLGGETLFEPGKGNTHLGPHALGRLVKDCSLVTPRQKLGVTRNVDHQIEHFGSAVPNQDGLLNGFHTITL